MISNFSIQKQPALSAGFTTDNADAEVAQSQNDNYSIEESSDVEPLADAGTGSGLSVARILQSVNASIREMAEGTADSQSVSIERQSLAIDVNTEAMIDEMNKRTESLLEAQEAARASKGFGILSKILGAVAVAVTMVVSPAIAVAMLALAVASYVLPKVVDEVLSAIPGVSEKAKEVVAKTLNLALTVISLVVSAYSVASSAAAKGAKAAGDAVEAGIQAAKDSIRQLATSFATVTEVTQGLTDAANASALMAKSVFDLEAEEANTKIKSAEVINDHLKEMTQNIQENLSQTVELLSYMNAVVSNYRIKSIL